MTVTTGERTTLQLREIEEFLYLEARLADEHDYDGWEALWTDDAVYFVPAGGDDIDPNRQVSIIYDNRQRISTRMKQLKTGQRPTQTPRSRVRRVISNVEMVSSASPDTEVKANFMLVEARETGNIFTAGRTTYRLRKEEDRIRMSYKKVELVDSYSALPTLSFIL
jgi:benzoate/toluate 1,2-dioxygenase beta subunit